MWHFIPEQCHTNTVITVRFTLICVQPPLAVNIYSWDFKGSYWGGLSWVVLDVVIVCCKVKILVGKCVDELAELNSLDKIYSIIFWLLNCLLSSKRILHMTSKLTCCHWQEALRCEVVHVSPDQYDVTCKPLMGKSLFVIGV